MNRRLLMIALAASGALLGLWFLLLWGPQGGKLDDANERKANAESANDELELRVARLKASQERAPELLADVEELRRAVPDDPELAQFILDANQVASDAGVDFLSISPAPPAAVVAGPAEIRLQITVTGGYFAVLDYLSGLADLPRLVVVDDLSLTPSQDQSGVQRLSVNLSARMFTTTVPGATTTTTAAPGATTTTVASNG